MIIAKYSNNKFTVDLIFDDLGEKDLVEKLLTVEYEKMSKNWRTKRIERVVGLDKFYKLSKKDEFKLSNISKPMVDLLDKYLSTEYDIEIQREGFVKPKKIEPMDKWVNFYKGHPKPNLGEAQLESYEAALNNQHGIIAAATGCFVGETRIRLLNGESRTIESLVGKSNFHVISVSNKNTGQLRIGKVLRVWKTKEVNELIKIVLSDNSSFTCTLDHRIMTGYGEYKEAQNLREFEYLMPLMLEGFELNLSVKRIEYIKSSSPIPVYDMEVEKYHNFAIETGYKSGVIVHNSGKTEILIGIAESYLNSHDGRVLIMAYSNKVKEEISLRIKKYGLDFADRLDVLNIVGYFRSNKSQSKEAVENFKKFKCILADEAHHFSSLKGKWAEAIYTANPDFIFGFTATPEIEFGKPLYYSELGESTPQGMSCMYFCGEVIKETTLSTPIDIVKVDCDMTDKDDYEAAKTYGVENNSYYLTTLHSLFITNKQTPKLLKVLIDKYSGDNLVFIPELTSIEVGSNLAEGLNKLGVETIYFSATKVITPGGEVDNLKLEDLKELSVEKAFKVLISNSAGIEGIDLKNMNTIIPLGGSSYKNTLQAIGRGGERVNQLTVIIILDKYNYQISKQQDFKYKILKERLNVNSITEVEILKEDL